MLAIVMAPHSHNSFHSNNTCSINEINFNWFDFHAECKGMHYENIQKLLTMTEESVSNAG